MPYRRTTAVQERLDAARARLLDAAEHQVRAHGWAGCSVAAVAEAAGVATGTVYRHLPDKAALLVEVFRIASQREVDAVAAAANGTGPVVACVARCVEVFAQRAFAAPRLAYALLAEPASPEVEAARLEYRRAYRAVFAALVAEGVERGELPAQDAEVAAAAIVGALAEVLVVPLRDGALPRGTLHALTATTLRTLGAPA
ncbi:TetR/AcrR family transcriptional regulator [Nocardioides nanhaiensis]|uniref:TetR/AcrR family transcriptional regulator n=1 Tax=Nocardioides nanhaiensis TaxID=1476871 RepID=A0ABP8VZU7_9ACTN